MACIAIRTRSSFLVTVHAPLHIISVDHFYRSITHARYTMAGGAIYFVFNVNPVREDNKFWKLVHPLPRNLFACLHILNHFQCLGPLANRIGRMTGSTEFNVRNPRNAVVADILMAEKTVQLGHLFVEDMIEKDRLINRFTLQNWEKREKTRFLNGLKVNSIL